MAKIKIVFEDDVETIKVYAEGFETDVTLDDIKSGKFTGNTSAEALAVNALNMILDFNEVVNELGQHIDDFSEEITEKALESSKKKYYN